MSDRDIKKGESETSSLMKAVPASTSIAAANVPITGLETTAFSNSIRLTLREWLCVGLFTMILILSASPLAKRVETCTLEPDHRMPHELGNDYWLYNRYADLAADKYDTLLIGD